MAKPFRHYNLPSVYKETDWPLKTVRNALQYSDVVSATVHELYELSSEQPEKMWEYLNNATSYAVPESFVNMIKATYEEGIALHKLLGPEFLEIKQSHLTEQQRTALEEKIPSEDERAGQLHVAELLAVMRRQSSQALLHEEALINDVDYQASLEETDSLLAARGHYGIYRLVMAQPTLKEKLDTSKKAIVVPFAQGVETHGEPSLSNYTVAAYLNSERAYHEEHSDDRIDHYMEQAYTVCGGEAYANAFEAKCAAISGLEWSRTTVEEDFPLTLNDIASRSPSELFKVGSKQVKLSEAYAIKHAVGLMNPVAVHALEAAGKFNAANARVIDSGFHNHMGSSAPYAEHIRDTYQRAYEKEHAQTEIDTHTTESDAPKLASDRAPLSIGHDVSDARETDTDAQKKTPGQNASEAGSGPGGKESDLQQSNDGKDQPDANHSAAAKSETSKNGDSSALAIKAGGALLGSLVAIDQVRRANKQEDTRKDGSSKSESGKMHYVIAAAAALGVGALLLTSKQSISKIFGTGHGKA